MGNSLSRPGPSINPRGRFVPVTARTDDSLLRIIIVVVAVLLLFPLLMMGTFPMMGMMGGWGGTGSGMGFSPLWGLGMMLLLLVVVVGIGYFLFQSLTEGALSSNDRALEELRVAYARGDLSKEEFEERRELLEEDR